MKTSDRNDIPMLRSCSYDPRLFVVPLSDSGFPKENPSGQTTYILPVQQCRYWYWAWCEEHGVKGRIETCFTGITQDGRYAASAEVYMDGEIVGRADGYCDPNKFDLGSWENAAQTQALGRALANAGFFLVNAYGTSAEALDDFATVKNYPEAPIPGPISGPVEKLETPAPAESEKPRHRKAGTMDEDYLKGTEEKPAASEPVPEKKPVREKPAKAETPELSLEEAYAYKWTHGSSKYSDRTLCEIVKTEDGLKTVVRCATDERMKKACISKDPVLAKACEIVYLDLKKAEAV